MMDKLSSHKGMSQILTLIVAASVLMMTALIIVFMAQGSLNDLFSSTSSQGCQAQVQTKCSLSPGQQINRPAQCSSLTQGTLTGYQEVSSAGANTITCASANVQNSGTSGTDGTGDGE